MLLQPKDFYQYQREAITHQLTHDKSMLWLQMGLGKTPISLTTIVDRMRAGTVKKTLIFGPLRVIHSVWAKEARKWEHTKHLRFSVMHGTPQDRTRAMFADADIFLCNYENMNWLAEQLDHFYLSQGKELPFEFVIYDEISKLKNAQTRRMKGGTRIKKDKLDNEYKIKLTGWRKMVPHFKFASGLTGTPAPNGYLDLHGQYLAIDGGKRLEPTITAYKDNYFTSDYNGWKYTPTKAGAQWIEHKISDITIKMDAADYLDMPDVTTINIMVDLPASARKAYKEIEKEMFTQLENGNEIEVFSRSSVSNKCLQFCVAGDTEVLTDSGWKQIQHFNSNDKIWDGVEWSSVHSLAFNGVKEVIECDGVFMTPDHKVLTVSGWVEAEDISNGDASERFDRAKVRLPSGYKESRLDNGKSEKSKMVSALYLWESIRGYWSELKESPSTWNKVMRLSQRGSYIAADGVSWNGEDSTIHKLDKHEVSLQESERQGLSKLRRSRNHSVRRMVRFILSILEGHGSDLPKSFNDRESGQQQELLQRELSLGHSNEAVEQHPIECANQYTDWKGNGDSGCSAVQTEGWNHLCQNEEGLERSRSNSPRRIEKVYDLINAGVRHRFTVRGKNGEVFIVHNCNGSPYIGETKEVEYLHGVKIDALEEILEGAAGKPVLCSYTFVSDAERIMKKFGKKYRVVDLTKTKASLTEAVIERWNRGEIDLMVGHPASMGHGIDGLQEAGSIIVWFGVNWSLELYEQMIARLNRNGQTKPVSVIRILCNDTVDLAVADAIERKTDDQEGLKAALQRYREGITTNDLSVNFF